MEHIFDFQKILYGILSLEYSDIFLITRKINIFKAIFWNVRYHKQVWK